MYLHALIPATLAFSVQVHSLAVKPFSSESPMVYDVSATVPYLAPNSVLTRDGRGMVDSGISAVAIHVINSMATPVTAAYFSDQPPPGYPTPSLDGAVSDQVFRPGETVSVIMPRDFSGMAAFGVDGVDDTGTKWEASLSADSGYQPHIDVSFVDGYSVPMTCACGNEVVSGCNIELWDLAACPEPPKAGRICPNTASEMGPPLEFFSPCAGSAYTFAKDDRAESGCPGMTEITCCLGTNCQPGRRQQTHYVVARGPAANASSLDIAKLV